MVHPQLVELGAKVRLVPTLASLSQEFAGLAVVDLGELRSHTRHGLSKPRAWLQSIYTNKYESSRVIALNSSYKRRFGVGL